MKRTTPIKKEKQAGCRFYKSNLPMIVWDPDTNSALADFSEGHFTTEDPKVAEILRGKGYPEIPLDLESPPDIIVNQPTRVLKDQKNLVIPNLHPGMSQEAIERKMDEITEEVTPVTLVNP